MDIPRDDSPPDPTGSPKVTRMKSRRSDAARPVTIDGFEMGERIGSGGFSVVYRARQLSMNREVAIKVLNTGFATEAERRTFERECHALGQLSHHPNIVTVFNDAITDRWTAVHRDGAVPYHLPPADRARSGRCRSTRCSPSGVRIAGALQIAHDAGVLHRDIKPHNIFVSAVRRTGARRLRHLHASTTSAATAGPAGCRSPTRRRRSSRTAGRRRRPTSTRSPPRCTTWSPARRRSPSPELRTTVRRILTETRRRSVDRATPPGLDRVLRAGDVEGSCRAPGVGVRVRRDAPRGPGQGRVRPHADPAPHRRCRHDRCDRPRGPGTGPRSRRTTRRGRGRTAAGDRRVGCTGLARSRRCARQCRQRRDDRPGATGRAARSVGVRRRFRAGGDETVDRDRCRRGGRGGGHRRRARARRATTTDPRRRARPPARYRPIRSSRSCRRRPTSSSSPSVTVRSR